MQPPEDLLEFLDAYSTYYLISHIEPDGDCLSSSLTLGEFLQSRGKTVWHFNEGPFQRTEIERFVHYFDSDPATLQRAPAGDAGAVVLDCSTRERVGGFAAHLEDLPVAVVDHHSSREGFGDVEYIDAEAPSTTYLVQLVIEAKGACISPHMATLLFFGLSTDTGFFRHLDHASGDSFRAAARLIDSGASPKEVFAMIYSGRTLASRKLNARLLERAELVAGGSCLLTVETREDTREFGVQNRDTDTLYQLLLGVQNCTVVALLREEGAGSCSGSLRSTDDTDVGEIARMLGGGGHRRAAGFYVERPLEEVKDELVEVIDSRLHGQKMSN